jgi:hypothetical protein
MVGLLWLMPVVGHAQDVIQLADEIALPVPSGWFMASEGTTYPFQLVGPTLDAEILIFRSEVTQGQAISDENDLQISISRAVDDIIPNLPQSQMLSSTGYLQTGRAGFTIEFRSADSLTGTLLHHRLAGWLYRHPDGYQLLFMLWARCPTEVWTRFAESFELMQSGLEYLGPHEAEVFIAAGSDRWYMFLAPAVVIGLLVVFLRFQARQSKIRFAAQDGLWRCSCGRLNHDSHAGCRRCGRSRIAEKTT